MAVQRSDGSTAPAFSNMDAAPSTSRELSQDASSAPLELSRLPAESAGAPNQPQGNAANDKPWVCLFCMKEFARVTDLKTHNDKNMIDGKHLCRACGKLFKFPSDFKRHHVRHTGEKPYSCDVCGRKFSRDNNLSDHKLVHTHPRPFSCRQCGAKYKHRGSLRTHVRKNH